MQGIGCRRPLAARQFPLRVPRKTRTRTPLQVRHAAALKLVAAGELDGVLALSLVVWPRRGSRLEHAPSERQFYSEELKAEVRERHAAAKACRSWRERRESASGR